MEGKSFTRGFTLIELLVTLGILAVLATTVVFILNPVELFAQARDSQRIHDSGILVKAFALLFLNVSNPDMDGSGASTCVANCFTHITGTGIGCGGTTGVARHGIKAEVAVTGSASRAINGSGWIPVNFSQLASPPLVKLPVDPQNTTTYFYSYACDDNANTFEIDTNMESDKYEQNGPNDVESNTKDGGNVDSIFEKGSLYTL